LISALSLSMAVVVASLVEDEPPPPPPPPPPDFFALDVEVVDVLDEVDEVELLLDVPLVSELFVPLVPLVLAVEFDALALLLVPVLLVLVVAVA
jgi:hypothetical protein